MLHIKNSIQRNFGGYENSIRIFEKDGTCKYVLNGHVSGVRALCLLKNDKFASGSADKTVRIWSLKQHKTIKVLKDQSNPIIGLTALSGDKLASCSFREILMMGLLKYMINILGLYII